MEKEIFNNEIEIIGDKHIYRFGEGGSIVEKTYSSVVTIDGNWITIERKKSIVNTLNHGLDGIKKIHIKNISGVQFREPSNLTNGYIQFVIIGSSENKGGLIWAVQDENTIVVIPKTIGIA